jgi:hypothetical protein
VTARFDSFALSYKALSNEEQQAFRLLGMLAMPDFAVWVAAALLRCSLDAAENLIERLVDAQLVEAGGEDATGQIRYRLHDLLRVFARERLREEDTPAIQRQALERVLAAYLGLTERAGARLGRDDHQMSEGATSHQQEGDDFGLSAVVERLGLSAVVESDPLVWFGIEQGGLVAAVAQAHDAGLWELTWKLAGSLSVFLRIPRPVGRLGAGQFARARRHAHCGEPASARVHAAQYGKRVPVPGTDRRCHSALRPLLGAVRRTRRPTWDGVHAS